VDAGRLEGCWLRSEQDRPRLDRVGSLFRAVATNLNSAEVGYRIWTNAANSWRGRLRHLTSPSARCRGALWTANVPVAVCQTH
jgi:hypothetical protein